jgi:anti-sigma regulatory factor (Ser/Thr protein kinase)
MTTSPTGPHQVLLHGTAQGRAAHIASFVSVALLRGEAALLIAAPGTLAGATEALVTAGIDVEAARTQGRYVELDAAATLAVFRDGDGVDADRFHALVPPLVAGLAGRFGAVAAYGEMVGLLVEQGDLVGALRLEELWGPVTRSTPMRLLCGYAHELFDGAAGVGLGRVHALHDVEVAPVEATWAFDLPVGTAAAPIARTVVADLLAALGKAGTEWADDAELVVAELVGNAVRYGGSRPTLSVDVHGADVTLSVTDASEKLPVPGGDPFAENGRGYVIIDALSDAWGVERLPFGKRVWARLLRP